MLIPNTERHGWQTFVCEECMCKWEQTTRDYMSPSVDSCPNCNWDCRPVDGQSDRELPLDKWGDPIHTVNILEPGIPDDWQPKAESQS